jgi:hypothetical protein|tara:strand:+ start:406 stop:1383 length:978 start_codon:yes stop_codon:yes gene_type:complete
VFRYFYYILFYFVVSIPAFGQVTSSPIIWQNANNKSATIKLDNDTYYLTDYYYTYGLEIKLILPVFNHTPLSPIFPKVSKSSNLIGCISIAQRLYTPKNIRDTLVQFNDRPFAATLELDHTLLSYNTRSGIEFLSRVQIGVIGPIAGGERFHRKIHEWIKSPDPKGWDYQIANDIILNYDLFLNYPLIYKSSYKIATTGSVHAGTLFDDIGVGLNFAAGKDQFVKKNLSIGSRKASNKKLKIYFSGDAFLKLVLYNATLQGGLFSNNDPYVLKYSEISKLVFSANATLGLLWKGIALSYTHYFLTKEFDMGTNHNYGSFTLSIYF